MRLRTANGDVTLTLPGSVGAAVEARTSAGAIHVEGLGFTRRPLDPDGAGARFAGRLGRGGAKITLRTENGTIALREGRVEKLPREQPLPAADSLETAPPDTVLALPDTSRVSDNPVSGSFSSSSS